jgi:hypothetical protein
MNSLRAAPVEINWHSGLPIFASEPFLKAVSSEYGWIGGTDSSGQIRCVLPYTVIHKPGFRIVRFRIETIPLHGEFDEAEEKSFLNHAVEYFRSAGADMIVPASNNALFRTYPEGAVVAPYSTFIKNLNQPEEKLWDEISEAYRKDIRRAIKAGVTIEQGRQHLETAYRLTADTLKRSGAKLKNYDDFRRNIEGFGDNVRIFVALNKGAAQACLVTPFSAHTAYALYGGTLPQPVKGAMHLLHWEAIRQCHGMGVSRFNFTGARVRPEAGSKQEGIMTFKMRFGGKLVQGYMWKYAFHRLKFAAYSAAFRLLKGGDVVDLEHHKLASE